MDLRNIAIIAHVDHGKTTLVDALFRQSGTFRDNQRVAERAMDSNDLERERGITILSKCTSVIWGGTRINIVDTPGHADFGGEVERILDMVDGVLILVDAAEGPMPQTKFVTQKALALGLRPIVVINKVDRPDARIDEVHEEIFDLFVALGANEEQLDFPLQYAAGRDGWSVADLKDERKSMEPLFKQILAHVRPPETFGGPNAPFSMLASMLEADSFLGRIITGRIHSGTIRPNMIVKVLDRTGKLVENGRITKIMRYQGLERTAVDEATAGDIVAISGLPKATVSHTLCDAAVSTPIQALAVDPPTLSMTFAVNDSPLAGRDGSKVTSRVIGERLMREAEGNVAIKVTETASKEAFEVGGRGELQLGILIETMRREGYEMSISRPRVIMRDDPDAGQRQEPIEEVVVDVDDGYSGGVVEALTRRKGELQEMRPSGVGRTRLVFLCPSRGLIGYHGLFLTETRGTGVMYRLFHGYSDYRGPIEGRRNGVLISNTGGNAVPFALWNLEERGAIMVDPGSDIYVGMIIGEHSRGNDLDVNPAKAKQLTNIRAAMKDDNVRLTPPKKLSLEQALAYIDDDELVEVTPNHIRLRKRFLDPHDRKRAARAAS